MEDKLMRRIELPNDREIRAILASEKLPPAAPAEGVRIRGLVQSVLRREDGSVLYQATENLVTDDGFDLLCNVLGLNAQPSDLTHIAVGTGTTAAAAGDSALGTQVARKVATYAHTTGTKVMSLVATFGPNEGTGALTEAGCLNAANGGVLFNRVVFDAINKAAGDSLEQSFQFTFA